MTNPLEPRQSSLLSRLLGRWEARDIAPLVSLAVLVLFFAVATPNFLSPFTLIQLLKQGAAMGIVAVGLTFVLICAEIDLSVGMMALWSACLCGWLFEHRAGGPAAPSAAVFLVILAPLLSCLTLGVLSGMLTVWTRLPSFIITLAMWFIAEGMARYLTKSQTTKVPELLHWLGNGAWDLGGSLGLPQKIAAGFEIPYNAILAGAVFVAGHVVLQHTRFGRYVYMTGGNREAARLAGVRTGRIVVACLAISALAAGVGGLLNAGRLGSATLDQNKDLLLSAVACVVLGGTSLFGGEGSMGKTLIGVFTYTALNVGLSQIRWIDEQARPLLTGIVLMVALVINGVFAKRS